MFHLSLNSTTFNQRFPDVESIISDVMEIKDLRTLCIVIVNYRTADLVVNCLQSIYSEVHEIPDLRVVVIDNASKDESPDCIEASIIDNGWEEWAELVRSPVNGGFSAGNNIGIRRIQAKFYLLLNSDTLVRKGALSSLLEAANQYSNAGIIGPRLECIDGTPQESCFRFRHPVDEFFSAANTGILERLFRRSSITFPVSDQPMLTPWICFACVLIRHEVIAQAGLLDEGFFMYQEDTDYCQQAGSHSWKVLYWPESHVVHLEGGSSLVDDNLARRERPPGYYYASRSRYIARYFGVSGLWLANVFWTAGWIVALSRQLIGNKKSEACKLQWRDIWTNALHPLKAPIKQQKRR